MNILLPQIPNYKNVVDVYNIYNYFQLFQMCASQEKYGLIFCNSDNSKQFS